MRKCFTTCKYIYLNATIIHCDCLFLYKFYLKTDLRMMFKWCQLIAFLVGRSDLVTSKLWEDSFRRQNNQLFILKYFTLSNAFHKLTDLIKFCEFNLIIQWLFELKIVVLFAMFRRNYNWRWPKRIAWKTGQLL